MTGLALAASGVLGMTDGSGELVTGSALTIAAFSTTFGNWGGYLVSIGIALFAFATIIAWEYQGEKAFEFLVKSRSTVLSIGFCMRWRCFWGLLARWMWCGTFQTL